MFRFIVILILLATLTFGWIEKKGDLPRGITTIEALLHPVFHKETISHYAQYYREDPMLIMALIKTESHFFKKAKSPRGAIGLMQIMPSTAKEIAKDLKVKDFKLKDLEDPKVNIHFGAYYLFKLRKEFGNDLPAILAAYNAGGKNVKGWMLTHKSKTLELEWIEFYETRKFVQDVLATYRQLKKLKEWREKILAKVVKKYENHGR